MISVLESVKDIRTRCFFINKYRYMKIKRFESARVRLFIFFFLSFSFLRWKNNFNRFVKLYHAKRIIYNNVRFWIYAFKIHAQIRITYFIEYTWLSQIIKSICTYRSRDQWCKEGLPMDYLALRRTYPLYPSGNIEISWNLLVKKVYPIEHLIDTSYIKGGGGREERKKT